MSVLNGRLSPQQTEHRSIGIQLSRSVERIMEEALPPPPPPTPPGSVAAAASAAPPFPPPAASPPAAVVKERSTSFSTAAAARGPLHSRLVSSPILALNTNACTDEKSADGKRSNMLNSFSAAVSAADA